MKINKTKRIGEIVIIAEGELLEFEIITGIFHGMLGYEMISKRRNKDGITEIQGTHDRYSRVILVNSPTSSIDSLTEPEKLYDFLYNEVALKYGLDLINDPTYILFDRDRKNNRLKTVTGLVDVFTHSQTDTDEQNGLLLLSYPSVEAFTISAFMDDAYKIKLDLGKNAKEYLMNNALTVNKYDDAAILHATLEFIKYLQYENILHCETDLADNIDSLGSKILKCQSDRLSRHETFCCVSQLVEMLIELGLVEI